VGDAIVLVNLHTHSTVSDGDLPPEELAALLSENGVAFAALTDHDSLAGSAAFRASLARRGIGCVDGVELTTETSAGQAHVLAYGVDPENPDMLALLPSQYGAEARSERRRGPRQSGIPSIAEAIRAVHAAGGAAFLAHPLHLVEDEARLEALIRELAAQGLDGIEAIYAGYGPERRETLLAIADRQGLAVCAGGDFHEEGKRGQSAAMEMSEDRWIAFRDLLLRRSGGASPDAGPGKAAGSARKPLPARLAARIVLPALITLGVFISSLFLLFIPRDENLIMDRKKETIRELTEVAVSILAEYDSKAAAGTMTAEQARAEATRAHRGRGIDTGGIRFQGGRRDHDRGAGPGRGRGQTAGPALRTRE
jgi:3',5'-nucleoside bisphosphate phosphatase